MSFRDHHKHYVPLCDPANAAKVTTHLVAFGVVVSVACGCGVPRTPDRRLRGYYPIPCVAIPRSKAELIIKWISGQPGTPRVMACGQICLNSW